jgi:hypothetical protein
MKGSNGNGNGGGRVVPRFRIFGVGAGSGANGDPVPPKSNSATSRDITSEVRPSSLSRSTSSGDMKADHSLPVLLSVRKMPPGTSDNPAGPPSLPIPSQKKSRGGFFRLFHRSATLLFQHPTTELNPNKPYKGSISLSSKDLRQQKYSAVSTIANAPPPGSRNLATIGGYAKRGQQHRNHHHQYQYHQRGSGQQHHSLPPSQHLVIPPPPRPPPPAGMSGSTSTLNSSVLHHNLEHDEVNKSSEDDSEHPSSSSGVESDSKLIRPTVAHASGRHPILQQVHSSSSNSVISSVDSSAYDSGAFSRTSSPEHRRRHRHHRRRQQQQQQLKQQTAALLSSSKSATSLVMASPLSAPSLVLAACSASRGRLRLAEGEDVDDYEESVDAAHILACLDAASATSHITAQQLQLLQQQYHQQQPQFYSLQNSYQLLNGGDVSITIGSSTKLTIAHGDGASTSSLSNARRSRLPLMGTSGLTSSTSPNKAKLASPLRTKISTVYVNTKEAAAAATKLSRSESSVTISNAAPPSQQHQCDSKLCTERVTVNGQHHCSCGSGGGGNGNVVRQKKQKNKEIAFNNSILEIVDCEETQPESIINV